MTLNKNVLLVGAGPMAQSYYKVLAALGCNCTIIGRSQKSAQDFFTQTGKNVISGGLNNFLLQQSINQYDAVIVATGVEQLANNTITLLQHGAKNILVEKPAGLTADQIQQVCALSQAQAANVLLAYNRRWYSSTLKAQELLQADGGITSFNFEFTEWNHVIAPLQKAEGVKEKWVIGNSSHVIDLAFYLGGQPSQINCYTTGQLEWHKTAVFAGAGKTNTDVLFTYQANWNAPGRWAVECLSANLRCILKPMEELYIQHKGSVAITKVPLDNQLDIDFKPGLYLQVHHFLLQNFSHFKTIAQQANDALLYEKIAGY